MENRVKDFVEELRRITDAEKMQFCIMPGNEDTANISASREGLQLIAADLLEASLKTENEPVIIDLYRKYGVRIHPNSFEVRIPDVHYKPEPPAEPPFYEKAGCTLIAITIIATFVAGIFKMYELIFG